MSLPAGASVRVDPIRAVVIANRIEAITREMGETMLRTSRSPIFSESRDFAAAIFDYRDCWVANAGYVPVIAGTTPHSHRAIVEAFAGDIHPGDVFILNDPHHGGNHPPDIAVAKPVFYDGDLRFWTMAKGHNADAGGSGVVGYNPYARDAWEDALRIPPMRLYEQGRYRRDVWDMILLNLRIPALVEGDLHCQVGATTIGERALVGLLDKYGRDQVEAAIDQLVAGSEQRTREEIRAMPNGVYRAERLIDHAGLSPEPIRVKLRLEISDDEIEFDLEGSSPQVAGYVNSPYSNTVSACYLALFSCIDPGIPMNEGSTRPVTVTAPAGSVVNALEPAATTLCTVSTCEAIAECGYLALAEAIPERSNALWARWFGVTSMGMNPRTGRPFADIHFMAKGGGGATHGYDGWDHIGSVICLGGVRAPDPELHELGAPFTVLRLEYLPESFGAGEWRGGAGVWHAWRVDADEVRMAFFGSGTVPETVPLGILGGEVVADQPDRRAPRRRDGRRGLGERDDDPAAGRLGRELDRRRRRLWRPTAARHRARPRGRA
ncbi:MAG: hydantoinase B/oxoprolinase family protein [Solirubrobacteraceae bacterium]